MGHMSLKNSATGYTCENSSDLSFSIQSKMNHKDFES